MNQSEMHIRAVKREIEDGRMTPTNSIGMLTLNLDEFQFEHKGGKTNIGELVKLKEHIDGVLSDISSTINMFIHYHKKSPKYWGRLEKDEYDKTYSVRIDLESFMQEESEGKEIIPGEYFIPDNYALAEKVEKAFLEAGGDLSGECGEHFRECTNWQFKNKLKAKKLINFIDKKYVIPALKERMEFYNIKKINFGEEEITFDYKK